MLEIFLSAAYIAFFLFLIGKMKLFQTTELSVKTFKVLFLMKIGAGLVLYFIYTKFYPIRLNADIFRYYDDSEIMYKAFFTHPVDFFKMITGFHANQKYLYQYYDAMHNWFNTDMAFNDSRTMIRLSALLRFFSMGTYYPHAIISAFLAMMGLTGIYRVFVAILPGRSFIVMLFVYLLPSTFLWSSGLIKEAFLMFAIGMVVYTLFQLIEENRRSYQLFFKLLFYIFCMFIIKPYILFIFFPGIISWVILKNKKQFRLVVISVIYLVYGGIIFFLAPQISGSRVSELLSSKQNEFYLVASRDNAGSVIVIPPLEGNNESLFSNMPHAFVTTFFRPILGESKNPLIIIASLENLLILLFVVACLFSMSMETIKKLPALFYPALFFAIAIFVLAGLVTPVMGALVRYKVPALPFMLFAAASICSRKWILWQPGIMKKNKWI